MPFLLVALVLIAGCWDCGGAYVWYVFGYLSCLLRSYANCCLVGLELHVCGGLLVLGVYGLCCWCLLDCRFGSCLPW